MEEVLKALAAAILGNLAWLVRTQQRWAPLVTNSCSSRILRNESTQVLFVPPDRSFFKNDCLMTNHQFSLPSGFNGVTRLFPLPNTVLFPGNVLPLHIFESRYREMIADALGDDQLLTIATLEPDYEYEYYSRPAVAQTVCIGQIHNAKRAEDDTWYFLLAGLRRATIEHEIEPVLSYRRAKVNLLTEAHVEHGDSVESLTEELSKRFLQRMHIALDTSHFTEATLSLAQVTDVAAHVLPLATEDKLQLLAEANPVSRARMLLAHLSNQ